MGALLPFTMNGSSGSYSISELAQSTIGRLATTSPAAAFAIRRAARFTASPIVVYTRRPGAPRSPANTYPRFTPARRCSPGSVSITSRIARSMRSSSPPRDVGTPAVRMNLPPSWYTSVDRKCTPKRSHASLIVVASDWSRCASSSRGIASVWANSTKLTDTWRCSLAAPARIWAACSAATNSSGRRNAGGLGAGRLDPNTRANSTPSAVGLPSQVGGRFAAAAVVSRISPAFAAASASTVAVEPGPDTTSSS